MAIVVVGWLSIPLAAAAWFADSRFEQRDAERVDDRLGTTLEVAGVGLVAAVGNADGEAGRLAGLARLQRALVARDRISLRRIVAQVPGATVWAGATRLAGPAAGEHAIAHRIAIVQRDTVIGVVAVQVRLDDALLARLRPHTSRSDAALLVVHRGRVVAGPHGGSRLTLAPGSASIALDGASYRVRATRVAQGVELVAAVPTAAVDAARSDTRQSVVLASLATVLLVVVLVDLLVPVLDSVIRRGRLTEEKRGLELIGGALGARHDREALLPIVLATMVEVAGAAGGVVIDGAREVVREGELGTAGEPLLFPLAEERGDGVLLVLSAPAGGFTEEQRRRAEGLAPQAAIALEHARLHELARRDAATDPLTGLANRRRFLDLLDEELRRAGRYGRSVAVVVADLDDFKAVNDRFGHGVGDDVLRAVAGEFRSCCRNVDLPARLGGEELAVLAPESDVDAAAELAERLRRGIEELRVDTPHGKLSVTASLGVAAAPPAVSAELLLHAADAALYSAKRAGKNRVARWKAADLEMNP